MQKHFIGFLAFITTLMLGIWSAPLRADQMICTSNRILIKGPSHANIQLDDETSSPLLGVHEISHYNAQLHTIVILNYRATKSQPGQSEPGLCSIDSRPCWKSYIAHELTHAAIHAGCDHTCPSRATHEYVAAVAQISVLPEQYRSRMLDAYRDLDAFQHQSEIIELYYALDLHYFAIKSYKHYQQQTNPKAFMWMMLAPN